MIDDVRQKMRLIPAMDILLEQDWAASWQADLGRETVKRVFNEELTRIRRGFLEGRDADLSPAPLREKLEALLKGEKRSRLRPVINATGVVVHTNLGRSRLAESALDAVKEVASRYSNLEYDLEEGTRGRRGEHVEGLLCALTGAEAALVVNNNAGAVLLCLSALARGTEVVVSRGELVEIGGSFRVPEIMEFSGAELVETGTTNRTHLKDYAKAITERTSMLLKVHPSNFRMEGFVTMPERSELAALAHDNGLIFMEDAGSGLLSASSLPGIEGETDIRTCLASGVDVVTFSGDKMLGGPQIGVIAGTREVVGRMRAHPVLRALRVDKMTLAAFEATMRLYMKGDYDAVPTLAMLRRTQESMKTQAGRLAARLRRITDAGTKISVVEVDDAVGGGSYPARPLMGWGVAVSGHPLGGGGRLQKILRTRELPVLCGARSAAGAPDALVIHVRTLHPEDEREIVRAFREQGPGAPEPDKNA